MVTRKCVKCMGKGVLMGLGMIDVDCDACAGVGYVEVKTESVGEPVAKRRRKARVMPVIDDNLARNAQANDETSEL